MDERDKFYKIFNDFIIPVLIGYFVIGPIVAVTLLCVLWLLT